jgi:hypothetical protein
MMPMPTRRKTRKMEKVKNFCRTATAQMLLPTRRYKSDHACAISAVCPGPLIIAPLVESRFCAGGLYRRRRHILRKSLIELRVLFNWLHLE